MVEIDKNKVATTDTVISIVSETKKLVKNTADGLQENIDTLSETIEDNASAIETLNGTGDGSVKKTVADEIAKVVADAPEDFDTLKEMSDWIAGHETDATAINSAITDLQNNKVNKVTGKGLSTNDFTDELKTGYDTAYTHSQAAHAPSNAERNIIIGVQKNGTDITPDINRKVNIVVDTTVKKDSANPVSGGGVYNAIPRYADTEDFAADLEKGGYIKLKVGVQYTLSRTVTLPDNTIIEGEGYSAVIRCGSAGTIICGNYTKLENIHIHSSDCNSRPSTAGSHNAVVCDGKADVDLDRLYIMGFSGCGILIDNQVARGVWRDNVKVRNVEVVFCGIGIRFEKYGDYTQCSSCEFVSCNTGAIVCGGNNMFVNCQFNGNDCGFYLHELSDTSGHGLCSGCQFNHNGQSIRVYTCGSGWVFGDCCLFYGTFELNDCQGITFNNCIFAFLPADTFKITSLKGKCVFSNNMVQAPPATGKYNINTSHAMFFNNFAYNGDIWNPTMLYDGKYQFTQTLTFRMGVVPPANTIGLRADFPAGFTVSNSMVLGVKVQRGNGEYYYSHDGTVGVVYYDTANNKIEFVPTETGVNLCAGKDVYITLGRYI